MNTPLVLALFACGPSDAPLDVQIVGVDREGVTFAFQSAPSVLIDVRGSGNRVETDSSGAAEMKVPAIDVASAGTTVARFDVRSNPLFGSSRSIGSGELELGFDPYTLTQMPDEPATSWVYPLGVDRGSENMRLYDSDVMPSAKAGHEGFTFVGPPGTTLKVDRVSVTVPENGVLRWTPSAAELVTFSALAWPAWNAPITIRSPGMPEAQGEVRVQVDRYGKSVIAAHVAQVMEGKDTWSAGPHLLPWGVLSRLTGELRTIRPKRGKPAPDGARLDQVTFFAVESAESETVDTVDCVFSSESFDLVDRATGQVVTSGSNETRGKPVRVTTRVEVREGPTGAVIAQETFVPRDSGCASKIHPDTRAIERWVAEVIAR